MSMNYLESPTLFTNDKPINVIVHLRRYQCTIQRWLFALQHLVWPVFMRKYMIVVTVYRKFILSQLTQLLLNILVQLTIFVMCSHLYKLLSSLRTPRRELNFGGVSLRGARALPLSGKGISQWGKGQFVTLSDRCDHSVHLVSFTIKTHSRTLLTIL